MASQRLLRTPRALLDYSFNKREFVAALSEGRERYIFRGSVTGFRGQDPVEAVVLRLEGSGAEVELRARAVVVAAGCGSKRLLRDLVGSTPQIEMIKHRLVHMLCLRAPRGALPAHSIVALSLGLLLAAHDDGENVTWYVTPMEMGGPSFDEAPNDATAPARPELLRRAWDTLQTLYPALPGVDGLQVGSYAGYRQDIGNLPGARLCAVIAGEGNVIAALPWGWWDHGATPPTRSLSCRASSLRAGPSLLWRERARAFALAARSKIGLGSRGSRGRSGRARCLNRPPDAPWSPQQGWIGVCGEQGYLVIVA